MRFKIDENLPVEAALVLQENGFQADSVYDEKMGGSSDSAIFDLCIREERTLVTLDLDFSDLRMYPPDSHYGIIIFRLVNGSKEKIIRKLKQIIPVMAGETLEKHIWIVDDQRIRIRGGPGWGTNNK